MKQVVTRYLHFVTVLLLFVITLLTSCKTAKQVVYKPLHDTVFIEKVVSKWVTIPADSALIQAWLDCDSLNQVYISKLQTTSGKTIKPQVIFKDKILTVFAPVDSQKIYLEWKERSTQITTGTRETITITKTVYPRWMIGTIIALFLVITIFIIITVSSVRFSK